VKGAKSYNVEVADNPSFTSEQGATTTNRRWVPPKRLPAGEVWWRVRANLTNGTSSWSETSFRSDRQRGPVNLSPMPEDKFTFTQPEQPPLLSWDAVPGAVEYKVEVTRNGFVASDEYETSSTTLVVEHPAADGAYEWRVTADLGDGILSDSSATGAFNIGPLSPVTTTYPDDRAGADVEDVVLDWDPVSGAVTYDLLVSSDPKFGEGGSERTTFEVTGIRGTRYSPPTTYPNNQYYWKVRAVNSRKEAIDWAAIDPAIFRRHWPDRPELLYPANQVSPAVGDDLYFQWSPVEHASHYELQVGTDPNFSPGTFDSCKTAATTYTPGFVGDDCMPAQGLIHYWRLRGIDDPSGVEGLFSDIRRFIYSSGTVTQLTPGAGEVVAVPTLRWAAAQDAVKYEVTINDAGNSETTITTHALSVTPSLDPADGPFTWRVQAIDNNGGLSPKPTAGRPFSIAGAPDDTPAAPLTPLTGTSADPATTRFPTLSWEPLDGAAYYKVSIGVHGSDFFFDPRHTPFLGQKHEFPAATDTGTAFLTPDKYDWFVTAYASNNSPLGTGPVDTFTITDLDAVAGNQLALTGTALDAGDTCAAFLENQAGPEACSNVPATPVLDWEPVPGAAFYMIYLAQDRELTTLTYGPTVPRTQNTRWTPSFDYATSALPDSQAGKAYFWYVRPCKSVSVCGPDPTGKTDAASHSFDKESPAPVLQPGSLPRVFRGDVSFHWEDYLATNLDHVYAETGELSYQAARQYRIEVSKTDSFGKLVDSREVDQTTYTAFTKTYPEGDLWWRVQAIDAEGNHLTWSPPTLFVKDSGKPSLESPIGDDETSAFTPLRWKPQEGAKQYIVEVYENADTNFSPGNLLFRDTTEQTAYAWDEPIPVARASYVWRVRRADVDGELGPWSDGHMFQSTGQEPTHDKPYADAYVPGNDAHFIWDYATGAASYRFERALVGSSKPAESIPTVHTSWAPLKPVPDGHWQWRVTALDARRHVLASSRWRRFKVDGSVPTVTRATPARAASPKSNFTVTFSEAVTNVSSKTLSIRKGGNKVLPGNVKLSANGRVATLNPSANLARRQTYTVSLSKAIRDKAGNPLAQKSWKVKVK
jgi:hypothetical protein